jgi:protein phosphatase
MKLKGYYKKFPGKTNPEEAGGKCLVYGITDTGKVRANNEDAFWINQNKDFFVVADGMGGHKAGEVASGKTIELLQTIVTSDVLESTNGEGNKIKNLFNRSLSNISTKIVRMGKENPDYSGMGCTVALAYLHMNVIHAAHVGDARIYVCNKAEIKQLGYDHSYVAEAVKLGKMTSEEARLSNNKNKITMAIGSPHPIEPEYNQQELKPGDRILLCSDGLWDMMLDTEIHEIMMASDHAKTICENLVSAANNAGGLDNITVVVSIV